jgi:hypothetical protein
MLMLDDEITALATISDRPNLTALAYALRHPETWPKNFTWNYEQCESCAMGLAVRLWPSLEPPDYNETWISREMSMSYREAVSIFFDMGPFQKVKTGWFRSKMVRNKALVTPDDVADAIDRYLVASA